MRAIEELKQAMEACELGALSLPDQIDALMDAGKSVLQEMPTLTQPNEPLTLAELREMDGEPVWVDDKKTWALLQVWDDKNIDVVFPMPKGCFHAKSVNGRKIYRRPPEVKT